VARLEEGGGKPPGEAVLLDIPSVSFFGGRWFVQGICGWIAVLLQRSSDLRDGMKTQIEGAKEAAAG
jgi:hypothetical protein